MARRSFKPVLVALEARDVPSTGSVDGTHLTVDFAPDNTAVFGENSSFFQEFKSSTDAAELAVLKAFQTWASVANINFGLIASTGAWGSSPYADNALAADIHVNAVPLFQSVGAISTALGSNTSGAGNLLLNAMQSFADGAQSGQYDLYTVALHEVGILLGLPENNDPTSVLYSQYTGARTGLSAADVAAVQAMYGSPLPNTVGGGSGNETLAHAANVDPSHTLTATLLYPGDVNYYHFHFDPNQGGATISVQAGGFSLLEPQVTVFDSSGRVVAQGSAVDPRNNNVTLKLSGLPTGDYFVAVSAAPASGAFGVGSYQIAIADHHDVLNAAQNAAQQAQQAAQDAALQAQQAQQQSVQKAQDAASKAAHAALNPTDAGAQNDAAAAQLLAAQAAAVAQTAAADAALARRAAVQALRAAVAAQDPAQDTQAAATAAAAAQTALNADQGARNAGHTPNTAAVNLSNTNVANGKLTVTGQVDSYQVQVPNAPQAQNLGLTVKSKGNADLSLGVTVLDSQNDVVPTTVLVNDGGRLTLLIPSATNQNFTVQVSSATGAKGNYQLSYQVTNQPPTVAQTTGALSAQAPVTGLLQVTQYQIVHFALAAAATGGSNQTGVLLTIRDASNNVVASLLVAPGSPLSTDVALPPGNYSVQLLAVALNGGTPASVGYTLIAYVVSNPVGITPVDPTSTTTPPPAPPGTPTTTAPVVNPMPTPAPSDTSTTSTAVDPTTVSLLITNWVPGFMWQTTPTGGTVTY
jgi:hypothetical protein